MTFYTPLVVAGTARTGGVARPVSWDGSERYGSYGSNILGD